MGCVDKKAAAKERARQKRTGPHSQHLDEILVNTNVSFESSSGSSFASEPEKGQYNLRKIDNFFLEVIR
jgi:hypothetical protein